MATRAELYGTAGFRVASALRGALVGVAVAGGLAAVATGGADWTAIPLLGGVAGALAAQLATGILGYRRAMGRAWPEVDPVADDDDW